MRRRQFTHTYKDIISIENLLSAWKEFLRGKQARKDVAEFSFNLSRNIFGLHQDLKNKTYRHGGYTAFAIDDPKPRSIHKACVRDRLLHHALYRILYRYFDRTFIYDSYSCRDFKGTHRAGKRFTQFAIKVSESNSRTCVVLKCDIRKFFASIDQKLLLEIVGQWIPDSDVMWLIEEVVGSFHSTQKGKGLPLGNLTSQLLVNIYINEFDQFVKHALKVKYYIRYADDFVIFSEDKHRLVEIVRYIVRFLRETLKLELHPNKVFIKTLASGVDFLGWIHFPDHRVLRTATRRRMMRRCTDNPEEAVIQSYTGLLSQGNAFKLKTYIHENWNLFTPIQ